MATTSKQSAPPHCSSSSSSSTSWDVFLSFYGKDTRRNFTSHLYSALVHAGISTFKDDPELEKGEKISLGLLSAIRGSKTFVVVLSENYASSRWCLDELVEILTCKRTDECLVIPVFYYVDPSDPRYQKRSFGDALDHHKKHYSVDLINNWRSALADITELSGYHLKTDANEDEADTVQQIVENLKSHLSIIDFHLEKYLVGIDSVVEEIYQKLSHRPIIDHTLSTKRLISAKILGRMLNLKLLERIGANDIDGNFKKSFHGLGCFRWHRYPWMRFPSSFRPPKLGSLNMPHSESYMLWKGVMDLVVKSRNQEAILQPMLS